MPSDAITHAVESASVSAVTAGSIGWAIVRFFAPAWIEQQILNSRTVTELKAAASQANAIHTDFARLNGTLEQIALHTEATHRATVDLGEKVGHLAERVAAVEAVQAPRGRGRR